MLFTYLLYFISIIFKKYSIKTVNNIFKSFRFEIQKENIDEIAKMFSKGNEDLKKYLNDIISLKDTSYTIQMLILLYFFSGIANLLGDRFIIFLILNVLLFYVPLDKNFPHFLFNIFIVCKQYFEGILGIIICLIPKYEDKKEDEIPEKKNQ